MSSFEGLTVSIGICLQELLKKLCFQKWFFLSCLINILRRRGSKINKFQAGFVTNKNVFHVALGACAFFF